jgi:hypothetical protein
VVIVHVHGDIDVFVEVQLETYHRTEQVKGCFEAGCIIRVIPKAVADLGFLYRVCHNKFFIYNYI